jgi:hypothetical protein
MLRMIFDVHVHIESGTLISHLTINHIFYLNLSLDDKDELSLDEK